MADNGVADHRLMDGQTQEVLAMYWMQNGQSQEGFTPDNQKASADETRAYIETRMKRDDQ